MAFGQLDPHSSGTATETGGRLSSPLRPDGTCCIGNVRAGEKLVCVYMSREYTNHHHGVAISEENFLFSVMPVGK